MEEPRDCKYVRCHVKKNFLCCVDCDDKKECDFSCVEADDEDSCEYQEPRKGEK
jgi:hypothetical protein